ncbi:hypothetical protein HNQ91_002307 [Filimonas zeae]|uniref:SMI1/KNR4 family protein n=1 Tax=Filimonas zeae TaxID=1737353 RepID=A0A917IV07_9BACT|nr:SMI1/KNR4 family protein [Filimonas zeae]MDR6339256.1 hypothetical protein [Filimonas zeae]GGH64408.1 hypothetical protein GCM10011379_16430 [Filimonas zeae]
MFNLTDNGLFLGSLAQRKQPPANLSIVPVTDTVYHAFLARCATSEITPDIILFGLEEAQKENACLRAHFPEVADIYWMAGRSGQGDEWFISPTTGTVLFYDHDTGEYTSEGFTDLAVSFDSFLLLAQVLCQLEQFLDAAEPDLNALKTAFTKELDTIRSGLAGDYPYNYFD